MNKRSLINRVNPPPCENSEWCPRCAMAFHCHEQRLGFTNRIFWPGIVAVLFLGSALIALFFQG